MYINQNIKFNKVGQFSKNVCALFSSFETRTLLNKDGILVPSFVIFTLALSVVCHLCVQKLLEIII